MSRSLLRVALTANALFSATTGLILLFLPAAVAQILGTGAQDLLYRGLGLGLLIFAADIALLVRRDPIPQPHSRLITAADVGWVVGTAALLAVANHWFSATGIAVVTAVAAVVGLLAALQCLGLRAAS